MNNKKDKRPPVAIGHINLITKDVPSTSLFMQSLGLRKVFQKKTFAVLELRGGTHLILETSSRRRAKNTIAPFDLMVDDINESRSLYKKMGLKPSKISTGKVHSSFIISGPDNWSFKITSSHTSGRRV